MTLKSVGSLPVILMICALVVSSCAQNLSPIPTEVIVETVSVTEIVQGCTLIGSIDTFTLHLGGNVPNVYTVVGTLENQEKIFAACPQPGTSLVYKGTEVIDGRDFATRSHFSCERNGVLFYSFTPEKISFMVTWEGKNKTETFTPEYKSYFPNGEGCPPESRNAIVQMNIP